MKLTSLFLVIVDLKYVFSLLITEKFLSEVVLVSGIAQYKQSMVVNSLNFVLATGEELNASPNVRMLGTSLLTKLSGIPDLMRCG